MMIYPLAIVLMLLSFVDKAFNRAPIVYILSLAFTAVISVVEGFNTAGFELKAVTDVLKHLPLYEQQIGWLLPAIVGLVIGVIIHSFQKKQPTKA